MTIYVYMFLIIAILAVKEVIFYREDSYFSALNGRLKFKFPIVYYVLGVVLYVILANRKFTGTDTYVYYRIFHFTSLQNDVEKGFTFLIHIVQQENGDFFQFEKLVAFLTLIPIFFVIYKVSPYPIYSLLIFFSTGSYFGMFNTMRQGLAIGLTFTAMSLLLFFKSKSHVKIVVALVLIFLAMYFHTTAILVSVILFIILFVRRCLNKNKNTIWFLCLLIVSSFFLKIDILQVVFNIASKLPIGSFSEKYVSLYGDSAYLSSSTSTVLLINFILIFGLFLISFSKLGKNNITTTVTAVLGIYLILLSTRNGAQLYVRITYYVDILLVLIFPIMLNEELKERKYLFLTIFIQISYIVFNFIRMIVLNYNGILPYGIVF
ncbi:EpsG family protein [Leuconostoc lactis]|uniref:EpsG family protein n=1 Tax=Leuconostoc lactis TaxID=1246 RepID=UPI0021BE5522|nr:EpsG family protein [Leuconostoc lactis]MCT8388161.1 EpsG family protein [Leuconostoc lactis]